jgi:hypothetical protein
LGRNASPLPGQIV